MLHMGERVRREGTRQQETQSGTPVRDSQLSAKMDAGQLHQGHALSVPHRHTHFGPSLSATSWMGSSAPWSILTMTFPKVSLLRLLTYLLWSPHAIVSSRTDFR